MPRYVAFLRAVNVGGRTITMERLRRIFADAGFEGAETFIASGNVIFQSRATNVQALERKIETVLQKTLGYPVPTFVRHAAALDAIAEHRPFSEGGGTASSVYVIFLRAALSQVEAQKVLSMQTDVDALAVKGQEIYWRVTGTLLDSKLSTTGADRALGPTTVRSRNTIVRLAAKLRQSRSTSRGVRES